MAVIGSAQPITRRVASITMTTVDHGEDRVRSCEVVDVVDARDDVIVIDEQVNDRRRAEGEQRVVEQIVGGAYSGLLPLRR